MTVSKERHTVRRYDKELEHLRGLVMEMGGLVEKQIIQSVQALDDEDVHAAREVIARDHEVNGLEVQADEECTNIIALRQPLGSDLRMIMAMSKTITDLERVGDEAEKIARMVVHIYDSHTTPPNNRLFRDVFSMAKTASEMLRSALDAMARLDIEKAAEIAQYDDRLDKELDSAMRHLITYMIEDPRTIGHAIDVTTMLKALERIGDHCKNIAEYMVFFVKGKDVRHLSVKEIQKQAR